MNKNRVNLLYIDRATTASKKDIDILSKLPDVNEVKTIDYRFRIGNHAENKQYLAALADETKQKMISNKQDPAYFVDKSLTELVDCGLSNVNCVFIPGSYFDPSATYCAEPPKKIDSDIRRELLEKAIIQAAYRKGIPVLSVCAGSWRTAAAFDGLTQELSKDDAKQHDGFESVRILKDKVVVKPFTMLYGIHLHAQTKRCLKYIDGIAQKELEIRSEVGSEFDINSFNINSTHWRVSIAPELQKLSKFNLLFETCALDCKTQTVEAYESKFGAPILAVQFHPEYAIPSYKSTDGVEVTDNSYKTHRNILEFMMKAGLTHHHKQKMVNELLYKFNSKNYLTSLESKNKTNILARL